jgi:transcriptional regulator with XRE-family HTH domain
MPEPSVLGKRLKAFRERAGISQNELARRAGVPRQTIGFVEAGIQENLSLQNALRIADALGITIDALVRGDPLQSELAAALAR